MPLAHKRAELLAHVHNTNSQYTLPAIGKKIAYKANRDGVAERFADAAVHKSIAVDLALITSDDALLRDVELTILKTAKHHDANTLYLLHTVPGIGKMLSLVLLYEIHELNRFPSGQDCCLLLPSGHMCHSIGRETAGDLRRQDRQGPSASGPLLKPLSCASETLQQRRNTSPAWRKNMTKGKP